MKNTRTWIILSIAILSGLLAVLLAGRWLDRQSHNDITQVVVARTEISLGQRLAPEMLKLVYDRCGSLIARLSKNGHGQFINRVS